MERGALKIDHGIHYYANAHRDKEIERQINQDQRQPTCERSLQA